MNKETKEHSETVTEAPGHSVLLKVVSTLEMNKIPSDVSFNLKTPTPTPTPPPMCLNNSI